jgi:hypothetical protein
MALVKKFAKEEVSDDREMLCSIGGCGARWTVQTEKPMCSYHQWKEWPTRPEQRQRSLDDLVFAGDPRGWAKKIIRDYEAGISRSKLSVSEARTALKMPNV